MSHVPVERLLVETGFSWSHTVGETSRLVPLEPTEAAAREVPLPLVEGAAVRSHLLHIHPSWVVLEDSHVW